MRDATIDRENYNVIVMGIVIILLGFVSFIYIIPEIFPDSVIYTVVPPIMMIMGVFLILISIGTIVKRNKNIVIDQMRENRERLKKLVVEQKDIEHELELLKMKALEIKKEQEKLLARYK